MSWFKTNRTDTLAVVGLPIPFNSTGDVNQAASDAKITNFNAWLVSTELPLFPMDRSVNMNAPFRTNGAMNTWLYSRDGIHPNLTGCPVLGTAEDRTHKGFTGFSFRRSLAAREDVPSPARGDVIGGERMAANALCAADGPASF